MTRSRAGNHDTPLTAELGSRETIDAQEVAGVESVAVQSGPWMVGGRYEILSLLGSGAMGTVYRARDRELDEVVALKMLRRRVTPTDRLLESFRREVKLSRRVTHVNVARTFDIGDHHGGKFITMELVAGETLRAVLARRTKLSLAHAVRIAQDLCAGLGAAHAAGIIHRDLKPENVILSESGRAVITDFGIARALEAGVLRQSGTLAGTPMYMAPEQLQASSDLDARVDVYALGMIFFELLTGRPPWEGDEVLEIALVRLREAAPDVRTFDASIPEDAAAFIAKCLARDRNERFLGVREAVAALDLVGAARSVSLPPRAAGPPTSRPVAGSARSTIAILPFVNRAGEAFDYLADHLVEDLVDMLAGTPEVRVRQRGTGAVGAEPERDAREAGRAIGVDSVLDGSLALLADGRLAVELRLVTVEDGFVLWSARFERPSSEVPAVADEATVAVASALNAKAGRRSNAQAFPGGVSDLYLRARYAFNRGWFDPDGSAVRLLREAHLAHPNDANVTATYARALARSYGLDSLGGSAANMAVEVAEEALAIDPANAEARVARALVHLYQGDALAAAFEVKRAIARRPDDPAAREMLGRFRGEVGGLGQAIEQLAFAIAKEPSASQAKAGAARAWALLGNWERADAVLGEEPAHPIALVPHLLVRARFALWRDDAARAEALGSLVARIEAVAPIHARIAGLLVGVTTHRTIESDASTWLRDAMPSGATTGPSRACFNAQLRAEIFCAAGQTTDALDAVRDAEANALHDLMWLKRCPLLEPLRASGALDAIERSTSLRAARIRDALD